MVGKQRMETEVKKLEVSSEMLEDGRIETIETLFFSNGGRCRKKHLGLDLVFEEFEIGDRVLVTAERRRNVQITKI